MSNNQENYYYSGQGRVLISERGPDGKPLGYREVGNVSALAVSVETSSTPHRESQSGLRTVDKTLVTQVSAGMSMTVESLDRRNLSLAVWGDDRLVEGGDVTEELHTAAPGAIVGLENLGVSNVVVTSEDGQTEYTLDEDYELFNADAGSIKILEDGTSPAEDAEGNPAKIAVSYTFSQHEAVEGLTLAAQPERYIRFEGLNTARDGKPVVVEVFKAGIQPLANLALINDEIAAMEVATDVLRDDKRATGSKFFRERMIQ